jgi:hypothetical protein
MSKLQWVLMLLGPNLSIAANLLRAKDTNSTGSDDLGADVLDYTGKVLQAIQFNMPMPDLPSSLRPKVEEETFEDKGD